MSPPHPEWRVGWGIDAHRLGAEPPVLLAGVEADPHRGVMATSDGDVVAHAVIDALLGAAALGDIGEYFPSSDPRWENADSMSLVARVVEMVEAAGWQPSFCDITVIAQSVQVSPCRGAIRQALAGVLRLQPDQVSVKATTTDGLGWLGRDEGIAATASISVTR
ncbi:MAG: 2-C-methyl-D-erythritol 2,4-cyclodiphosphate synthase [Actinomycetia bacterium]|nr:2-C-methyl-D-erythritol 2,4-cyclodiphosphate synthase [Actinomycetes bacterium]